jgi:hypothetical protein
MNDTAHIQMLNTIVRIVEAHGCRLKDVDFDTHRIELEGPEEKQAACALALADALGD